MLISLFQRDPLVFAIVAGVLLYSLVLHELAHALVADRVGDPTARKLGRITLNPLSHLDPLGTLLLLVAGFGWAKPVPIKPQNFRHYRSGLFLVSIAGVVVNVSLAVLALAALAGLGLRMDPDGALIPLAGSQAAGLLASEFGRNLLTGLVITARINLILAIFNLFPVPPLDGFKVLQAFTPGRVHSALWSLERYGFLLVIAVLVLFREPVFGVITTIMNALMRLLLA
ncbi:site-2 protease family protein [soil metagenome]